MPVRFAAYKKQTFQRSRRVRGLGDYERSQIAGDDGVALGIV